MTARGKIATAVGGSALGHLLLLGGAVGWIAAGGIPDNDNFSLRTKLGDAKQLRVTGSNYAASREAGEPQHAGKSPQSGSVWWSWRAPKGASDVLIEVVLQGGDPLLGVYQGFAVDRLEPVAQSGNGTLSFAPRTGTDYHIAVAGSGPDVEGYISLHIQAFTDEDTDSAVPDEQETALLLPEVTIEEQAENLDYVRTTQNERAPDAPANAKFESDRNTLAASELPPEVDGVENMPSQDGIDLPFLEMADRDSTEGELADDATIPIAAIEMVVPLVAKNWSYSIDLQPASDPSEPAEVVVEEREAAELASVAEMASDEALLAESGELAADFIGEEAQDGEGEKPAEEEQEAAVEAKPPEKKMADSVEPAPSPAQIPVPGTEKADEENVFQPHTRRNRVAGTISNRGSSAAVDAAETALGRYTRQVTGAVEKRWHFERRRKADYVTFGSLRLSFVVGASGKAASLKILEDQANPVMTDFTLGAILKADIPPMPKEVIDLLGDEPLEITYNVIIY